MLEAIFTGEREKHKFRWEKGIGGLNKKCFCNKTEILLEPSPFIDDLLAKHVSAINFMNTIVMVILFEHNEWF